MNKEKLATEQKGDETKVDNEDKNEKLTLDIDLSEFGDMPGVTYEEFASAHDWMIDRESVLEGMRDFIKEFIPVEHQVEFAGSDFGVFNGRLIELEAIGTPYVAEDGDDEPIFKAVKKCSNLYHSGRPVPTKLFLVGLGYQLVMEYDLTSCADTFREKYDEYDRLGPFNIQHWPYRTACYSYADPDGKKKLLSVLRRTEPYLAI